MKKRIQKKRFTFCIDPESMERLQSYLQKAGIPMSQFFNAFVIQTLQGLDKLKIPKDPSTMTLRDAALMFGRLDDWSDKAKFKMKKKIDVEMKKFESKQSK